MSLPANSSLGQILATVSIGRPNICQRPIHYAVANNISAALFNGPTSGFTSSCTTLLPVYSLTPSCSSPRAYTKDSTDHEVASNPNLQNCMIDIRNNSMDSYNDIESHAGVYYLPGP